jgi:hypothetical protein
MKNVDSKIGLVRELIKAENERDKIIAEPILSKNFIAIMRANGEEQNREELLKRIENPTNTNINRQFKGGRDIIPSSKKCGVIESIIMTTDKEKPNDMPRLFRNIHVFVKEDKWRCISWEVNEIKDEP